MCYFYSKVYSSVKDGIYEIQTDLTRPGLKATRVVVIDSLNGTEQEFNFTIEGQGTILKGTLIKDYPVFIRIVLRAILHR
ncbi:MAG: hypothetical protein AAB019_02000 [Planctomycetota bacterium]